MSSLPITCRFDGVCGAFSDSASEINFDTLRGKRLLVTWAHGSLARSWNSPQGSMLLASRFGMDITLARPKGYDMDLDFYEQIRLNCQDSGGQFHITEDPVSSYDDVHIVYSRNWISQHAYQEGRFQKEKEIEAALKHQQWKTTASKMNRTSEAVFAHPMPIERGMEVDNEVASGKNSIIYNVASNRLHVQKAIIAHTMSQFRGEKK